MCSTKLVGQREESCPPRNMGQDGTRRSSRLTAGRITASKKEDINGPINHCRTRPPVARNRKTPQMEESSSIQLKMGCTPHIYENLKLNLAVNERA